MKPRYLDIDRLTNSDECFFLCVSVGVCSTITLYNFCSNFYGYACKNPDGCHYLVVLLVT